VAPRAGLEPATLRLGVKQTRISRDASSPRTGREIVQILFTASRRERSRSARRTSCGTCAPTTRGSLRPRVRRGGAASGSTRKGRRPVMNAPSACSSQKLPVARRPRADRIIRNGSTNDGEIIHAALVTRTGSAASGSRRGGPRPCRRRSLVVVAPSRNRPKIAPRNHGSNPMAVFTDDQPATFSNTTARNGNRDVLPRSRGAWFGTAAPNRAW